MMINELVKKLSENKHEVTIGHRNESDEEIKKRIEDGYIHIKFTQTNGGTELGINIDSNNTNVKELDFNKKGMILHIEGTTRLNYNTVRCIAEINLTSRKGEGYLQGIDASQLNR